MVEETVREAVEAIEHLWKPKAVILFGSFAEQRQDSLSDIDMIIVSNDFAHIPFFERMEKTLSSIMKGPLIPLDCLCYTPDEFIRIYPHSSVLQQAVKSGVFLLGKREELIGNNFLEDG